MNGLHQFDDSRKVYGLRIAVARYSNMGYTYFMTRSLFLVCMSGMTRTKGLDYKRSMTRTLLLGYT